MITFTSSQTLILNLSLAIAKFEGYFHPDTLPQRMKNPGDLKFAGQMGAEMGESGFARFKTDMQGWEALWNQIALYIRRGDTITSMMEHYAPPSENDTQKYISFINEQTGLPINTPLYQLIA